MQKFHLDPEKVNAVFFTITVNGEPVKTKDNIVFLPNDELKQVDEKRVERYLAQKYADNQFDADVQFQVVAHHERAEQPDKDTLLIETLQKLAK